MRENKGFSSFTFDSAYVKYGVWTWPKSNSCLVVAVGIQQNAVIWLAPGVSRIFSSGLLMAGGIVMLIYFHQWLSGNHHWFLSHFHWWLINASLLLNHAKEAPLCGSTKYPYPHQGGNWKFRRRGGSKTQEIPKERGVVWLIYFPEVLWFNTDLGVNLAVQKSFLTY